MLLEWKFRSYIIEYTFFKIIFILNNNLNQFRFKLLSI